MAQEAPETDFAAYQTQQQWWFGTVTFVSDYEPNEQNLRAPLLDFSFSEFYLPADDYHLWSGFDEYEYYELSSDSSLLLSFQNCAVYGGRINLGNPKQSDYPLDQVYTVGALNLADSLFDGTAMNLDPTYYWYNGATNCDMQLLACNNLFRGGSWLRLEPFPASAGNWTFEDNLFDKVNFLQDTGQPLDFDYNGYWPLLPREFLYSGSAGELGATSTGDGFTDGAHEVTLSNAPPYQAGPFGDFYLPATTALYGAGGTNAAGMGLYQYTTRLDQLAEGSEPAGHKVNIGIHYVAPGTNGLPRDADADGIADYIEDGNGNGTVDANETDPGNAISDGVTNDIYNVAYDNIDLSSDGLVGRVKRALGMNPLDSGNPLTLTQVITGDEPDIATFEVPVSYSVLTNVGSFNLFLNGVDVNLEDFTNAVDGNTLVEWNTTYEPPGQHFLQARFTLGSSGDDSAILTGFGRLAPFYSSNVLQFFESDTMFDDNGAYLDAQLPEPEANYTIQLYDAATVPATLIKTITGSTTNGMIQENWNLIEDDGVTRFTNADFHAIFNVTLLDPASGSHKKSWHKLSSNEQGNGFDYVYMYMPTNSAMLHEFDDNNGDDDGAVWLGMQNVVDTLIMPLTADGGHDDHYDSSFNNYTGEGNNTHGNGLTEGWPGYVNSRAMVTNSLLPSLKDGQTKNFFCQSHGSSARLSDAAGTVFLTAPEVSNALGNHYHAKGGLVTRNPFRFVFLEGCAAASAKDWRRAFGIFPLDAPNQAARNNVGPQAYVAFAGNHAGWIGWSKDDDYAKNLSLAWTKTLDTFYGFWMQGISLKQCVDTACTPAADIAPFAVPKNKNLTVHGRNPETLDSFSYSFTGIPTSKIYITGHSGLTRSGLNSTYDKFYPAPVSTE